MNAKQAIFPATIALLAAFGFAIAAAKAQSNGTPHAAAPGQMSGNPAGKKAEEQFKNIQVLKGNSRRAAHSHHAVRHRIAGRAV
jgi:Spy/CpxP family protein refolding chaperone